MSERKLEIGMHLVFIDEHRRERSALLTAIHGDPEGRLVMPRRKPNPNPQGTDDTYTYETDENGIILSDYIEPGQHWPCVNLIVVGDKPDAQDQYGRQIERPSSVVHWEGNTAHGYCYRFADEKVDRSKQQPTIS